MRPVVEQRLRLGRTHPPPPPAAREARLCVRVRADVCCGAACVVFGTASFVLCVGRLPTALCLGRCAPNCVVFGAASNCVVLGRWLSAAGRYYPIPLADIKGLAMDVRTVTKSKVTLKVMRPWWSLLIIGSGLACWGYAGWRLLEEYNHTEVGQDLDKVREKELTTIAALVVLGGLVLSVGGFRAAWCLPLAMVFLYWLWAFSRWPARENPRTPSQA